MSPSMVNGLPAHVLFVHIVVVLVPLSALALVVCAIWPHLARRLGVLPPVLALVALVSVPLTTQAGEWLEKHVDRSSLVERHAQLGDGLLPWALGLFVLSSALWWAARRTAPGEGDTQGPAIRLTSAPIRAAAVVLSLVVATGSVVDVYRIGDSGAKAAWHDAYSTTTQSQGN